MTDYIKREDAINAVADRLCFDAQPRTAGTCTRLDFIDDAKAWIDECQSADAVQVVRCKDCKHWDEHSQYGYDSENGVYGNYCMLWTPDDDFYAVETPEDGFCYEGERKDNG